MLTFTRNLRNDVKYVLTDFQVIVFHLYITGCAAVLVVRALSVNV